MMYLRLFIVSIFLLPVMVLAQSSEFNIRTLVGDDSQPPSTPVITSVTPMSPNQIDIVWGASTDDTVVVGYRIFRDAVLLATTTQTNYTDTGLTPSTTYAYTVDAFDFSSNFSSTSLPEATTTLPLPPPVATSSPTTTTTASPTAVPALRTFVITPTQIGATVEFSSFGPTRYTLRFGRTTEYELGTVSSNIFAFEHVSQLSGLEPGTEYYIELTLINSFGVRRVVATETFTTVPAITSSILPSVTDVTGRAVGIDAVLSWQNPVVSFRTIRIVRNHLFYPQDVTDGVIVYEGRALSFTDVGAFALRPDYYYSIFVVAEDGRVSAPAVLKISRSNVASGTGTGMTGTSTPAGTSTMPLPLPEDSGVPEYLMPSDVFLSFGTKTYTLDSLGPIPTMTEVLVSIPFGAVPRHLKTILLSVYHPTNHGDVTTYLLKLRPDGGAYEVSFATSLVAGEGRLVVELFDFENQSVRRLSRGVQYSGDSSGGPLAFLGLASSYMVGLVGLGLFGVFLWWFLLAWRRRRAREDNH
jgi:hypothetical protein